MNSDSYLSPDDTDTTELASAHRVNLEALGSYNSLDFAVRLRPDLYGMLDAFDGGVRFHRAPSNEVALAFSTYLHENIHWWQHVGTTLGLMLSFLQPAHAHINRTRLDDLLQRYGPVKPLQRLLEIQIGRAHSGCCEDQSLNFVINNWHDLEAFRKLVINPTKSVQHVSQNEYFLSVGHSYWVALGAVGNLIASTVDPAFAALPNTPRDFENEMDQLRNERVPGFFKGSPIEIPPIGAKQILEGQARFSQLQYLHGASNGQYTFETAREKMLSGDYVAAFNAFLEWTVSAWPDAIDSPAVGLFLLICDLALSPSEGLLLPMMDLASIALSTDPGWRFISLCVAAKNAGSVVMEAIKDYTAEEYWSVSDRLSADIGSPSPRILAQTVVGWCQSQSGWKQIAEEDLTFEFGEGNFPIRVLLGRFQKIQHDKLKSPQFFCWPGMCMTDYRSPLSMEISVQLFKEHSALFVDQMDRDVYPRLVPGRDEATLQEMFDEFYSWVAMYEMTKQWMVDDGEFDYDYGWLTSKHSQDEVKAWASRIFMASCGVHPDDFKILT